MQKIIFLLGILSGVRVASYAQLKLNNSFHISINLTALKEKPRILVLQYKKYKGALMVTAKDTAMVKNNVVHFRGRTTEPLQLADITLLPNKAFNMMSFYLQAGEMSIVTKENLGGATITGAYQQQIDSLSQLEWARSSAFYNTLTDEEKNASSANTELYLLKMAKVEKAKNNTLEEVIKPYILTHARTSPVAVLALEKYAGDSMVHIRAEALNTIDSLYRLLDAALQQTPTALAVKRRIDAAQRVAIGKQAPDFKQPDTAGKMIALSSFRGRYVLIDFWASWCHWCRAQNPNLIKAFNAYHAKKFEILGVSLDNNFYKNAWLKAIAKDQTGIWTQVCEFSESNETNSAGAPYGIRAIPQNFLVDPNGTIIAVNLEGEALNAKLKEIFE